MTYDSEVLADLPLIYWLLDETSGTTAVDSSGNGHDGTYGGTYTQGAAPIGNSTNSLTVNNGGVEIADAAWMDVPAFTVEGWYRPTDLSGQRTPFARIDQGFGFGARYIWSLITFSNRAEGDVFNGGAPGQARSAAGAMVVDTDHHMVLTYEAPDITVYVNGVSVATATISAVISDGVTGIRVGRGWFDSGGFEVALGDLSRFAFYDTALSPTRIVAHYDAGSGVGPPPSTAEATASGESDATATVTITPPPLVAQAAASAQSDATAHAGGGFTAVGVTDNRVGGRSRGGLGYAEWWPAPTAPTEGPRAWDVALAFGVPMMDGAQPRYAVEAESLPRQGDRLIIGGVDVTNLRGAPTPFPGFGLEDPLMFGPTAITFPQIAAPFERLGVGALSWARKGSTVLVQRTDPVTGAVVATDYRGVVVDYDIAGMSPTLAIGGEAQGRLALVNRQVPLWSSFQDIGRYVYSAMKEANLRLRPYLGPTTGVRLQRFGGQSMLDYVSEILARSSNRSGAPWTIMPTALPGVYRMHRRDLETIRGTVYCDDATTVANLHQAASESPNRIFMTGVTPAGQRVRFGVYPGLRQTVPPPYPMDDDSPFGIGTTDGDTDTGDGITLMIARLIITKYLDQEDTPGGYDAGTAAAIRDLQEDAGRSFVNGIMDPQTWRALYDLDVTGYSLRWSHIEPAAQRSKVRRWNRSPTGAIIGRNPRYDRSVLVVDRNADVGSGFTRNQMREWGQKELGDDDDWTGTIVFNTGALVAGDHTPGDPITTADVLRARDLRPGDRLSLPLFDGGIQVHVATLNVDAGGIVTAAVDTRARDAMEVWEVITRNRESRNSPARAWRKDHRSSTMTKDSMGIWDEVGGLLESRVQVPANRWVVFPVVAGQEGTVRSLRVRTDPPAEFVTAVFGDPIYSQRLARLIGNPLTKKGTKRWEAEGVRDELDADNIVLYVAGDHENPCGYYPKQKVAEGDLVDEGADPEDPDDDTYEDQAPLTGRWEDDAGFSYHTGRYPVLYFAVYADRATAIPGGRIMWNQLEAGV